MKRAMSRRAFLSGTGGLLLSIPLFESLGCTRTKKSADRVSSTTAPTTAATQEVNKRLIMFFTSFGVSPGFFPTGGTETSFTLPFQLAPLAPHQADMLLLEDIDLTPFVARGETASGHGAPLCYVIGGWPIFLGDNTPGAGGISLDQKVAQAVGQTTRLRSLPINLGNSNQYLTSTISYSGANQPVAATRDPVAAFNTVFDGFNVDPAVLQAIMAQRKSVLDFVLDDYGNLSTKLGSDDKKLLDFHMESVRSWRLSSRTSPRRRRRARCRRSTTRHAIWARGSKAAVPITSRSPSFKWT